MAQITVVYKDFDEMKAVARELLKNELSSSLALFVHFNHL